MAIYTRISRDKDGEQDATSSQEAACRAFAVAREWGVEEVFEDVDLSAYKMVRRPAYERLRTSVASGAVDGVLVWKLDRLVRRSAEFERFWAACETGGVALVSVTEPIDTSTEIGLAIVRVLVTVAGLESSSNSMRSREKRLAQAKAGLAPGGPRPFGLTADWSRLVDDEVAMIREAAASVIAGDSLNTVAARWNEQDRLRPSGLPWQGAHLAALMRNPRLVGDRAWHGREVVASDCFPAALDRLTFARVRHAIALRAGPWRRTVARHLLTGIATCGRCGHNLHSRSMSGRFVYACPPTACGGIAVSGPSLEKHVIDLFLTRWFAAPRTRPRAALVATLTTSAERLEQINRDHYVTGILARDEYLRLRGELLGVAAGELHGNTGLVVEGLSRRFDLRHVRVVWPTLTTAQRRSLLAAHIEALVVAPVGSGSGKFDPGRVEVCWRSSRASPTEVARAD